MDEIIGIGTDIENIKRFEKIIFDENEHFLNKIFTNNELDYCFSKVIPAQHLAVRFAGKEAVVKALGSIGIKEFSYNVIEILNDRNGVPIATINNRKCQNFLIRVSLSHCEDKAIAFAIVIEVG